jgi:hypothetical protein
MKDDRVVGRVADREAFIRAIRSAGILCTRCAPFTGSKWIDGRDVKVHETDLDLPPEASGTIRLVRCEKCGRVWDPFRHEWHELPRPHSDRA